MELETAVQVVAEIGNIHVGQMERAKELIKLAAICGADYAKFQKRNPVDCVPLEMRDKPHPFPAFSYGETYLEHRQKLEFTIDQHRELQGYCNQCGIKYASSVWDIKSAEEIISLGPDYIKVPSSCNNNFELLRFIFNSFDHDVHISLGMSFPHEIDAIIDFLTKNDWGARTILYHCTSEYPCSFDRLYLLEIIKLINKTSMYNFRVGFSNHGYGVFTDIVAAMLGATWIERHFTDDRAFKHSDAAGALEPDGLKKVCRDLKLLPKILKYKGDPSIEELAQRKKLRMDNQSAS